MAGPPATIVCPGCGRLVETDIPRCPHCGRWRPGLFGLGPWLARLFAALDVTQGIVWVSVILYLLSLALDVPGMMANLRSGGLWGLLSPSGKALYQLGMTGGATRRLGTEYTTILSATFLHGSLLHIFFNMWWLRTLGPMVERMLGPARFFVLYTVAGAAGFLVSNQASGAPTVGASGAIFGLLAAAIVIGREEGGSWGDAVRQQAMTYAVLLFVLGFLNSLTNNLAHAGGFVGGWAIATLFVRQARRPEGPVVQAAALALAAATLVAVIGSYVTVSRLV